jgi:hypothetical protein
MLGRMTAPTIQRSSRRVLHPPSGYFLEIVDPALRIFSGDCYSHHPKIFRDCCPHHLDIFYYNAVFTIWIFSGKVLLPSIRICYRRVLLTPSKFFRMSAAPTIHIVWKRALLSLSK